MDDDLSLIKEALQEFIAVRTAAEYVARRYEGHDASFVEQKLITVQERVEHAQRLLDEGFIVQEPSATGVDWVRVMLRRC